MKFVTKFFLSFGGIFLVLGAIGVVLPIIPGWIFLLLSSIFFGEGHKHIKKEEDDRKM